MNYKISEIAKIIDGQIIGDSTLTVDRLVDFDSDLPNGLLLIFDETAKKHLINSKAKVIISAFPYEEIVDQLNGRTYIKVEGDMKELFYKLLKYFKISNLEVENNGYKCNNSKVSKKAHLGKNVIIGTNSLVSDYANISNNVEIGSDTIIHPFVFIGESVKIGNNVIIHPGAVISAEGFGFFTNQSGKHLRQEHLGSVIIENNVEIGPNTVIERGTLGNTLIKKGTKIGGSVHIGHNVTIGEHCLIVPLVGIAGSVKIGNHVVIAGQVGIADHVEIGNRAIITAKSLVTKNVEAGVIVSGIPAKEHTKELRQKVYINKIEELFKIIKTLNEKIDRLNK